MPTDEDQLSSLANGWQSIAIHTAAVAGELRQELLHLFSKPDHETEHDALLNPVPWHDVGKNHRKWQEEVLKALDEAGITGKEGHQPFAKFSLSDSPSLTGLEGEALRKRIRELRQSFRPGIAHEVASALAFRPAEQKRLGLKRDTDVASLLAEYIIMSHHGRVRKVLRDEIPKIPNAKEDTKAVRGVSEGDSLPAVVIDGHTLGCDFLYTDCRRMGREIRKDGSYGHESYTRGVLRLLGHYGPFCLAFFEALFRAADCRASRTSAHPGISPGVSSGMELHEEPPAFGATGSLTSAEQSLVADLVADGLSIQDKFRPEPLYKQTGKGHYASETVEEIKHAKKSKRPGAKR